MKRKSSVFAIAVAFAGLMMPANMAFADSVTLPPLPVLTSEWWQWALSTPTSVNPLADTTGQDCMIGQRDVVWFLAGTFSGASATRTCSVPGNAALFFPVINSINVNSPNVCGQGPENESVATLRGFSKAFIDGAHNLSVKVDNRQVKSQLQRVKSEVFEIALPEDNLFNAPCEGAGLGPVPAGIYSPAVDDGYYLVVQPLTPGIHTIQFHAEATGLTEDVTYTLNVKPVLLQ